MKRRIVCNFLILLSLIATITLATINPSCLTAQGSPGLTVTSQTDKSSYVLRQRVTLTGDILLDGSPANNLVIVTQVNGPLSHMAFRTLQIGNPTQSWPMNITGLYITDPSNNLIDTAKPGSQIKVFLTIYNPQLTSRAIFATITVFDANMVPVFASFSSTTIEPLKSYGPIFQVDIPKWAASGAGLIVANVYGNEPKDGGLALCLERPYYFHLSRYESGFFGIQQLPPPPPQNTPGFYNTSVRLSSEPRSGTYSMYVTAQSSPAVVSSSTTTFTVQNSSGYPPSASFIYYPLNPYLNMTVNFDASASTAEGYNDRITKYEWSWGDGTPKIPEADPYITHNFQQNGTFIITLNVTDSEGLWSTASKPITVLLDYGPVAEFTWTPLTPYNTIDIVTFNASSTTPGWSAKSQSYPPIMNYTWNYGDGSANVTKTTPTVDYIFGQPGTYTVMLTVVDSEGRQGIRTHQIQVLNSTQTVKIYDVNKDGIIDVVDVFRVARAYGSTPGAPNWDPDCDFNQDGLIDLRDYYPVCRHYGEDP